MDQVMKERGMIFNAEMVRAILGGRKTQTRRIMKDQPSEEFHPTHNGLDSNPHAHWYTPGVVDKDGYLQPGSRQVFGVADENEGYTCPFGVIGDRIWVRETFGDCGERLVYRADTDDGATCKVKRWTPSIHMPRCASRITLEITDVRVERLASIRDEDAGKEGYPADPSHFGGRMDKWLWFRQLWDGIYPEQSFKHNPWVWVIEFKRIEGGA